MPDRKEAARSLVTAAVRARNIAAPTFVRINPLEDGVGLADLAEVVSPGLSGIMLPKARAISQLEAGGPPRAARPILVCPAAFA